MRCTVSLLLLLSLCTAPSFAITCDGHLDDWVIKREPGNNDSNSWGLKTNMDKDPAVWASTSASPGLVQKAQDDAITPPPPDYGGEWFDIEAIYFDFDWYTTNPGNPNATWYLKGFSYALVTSYDGIDPLSSDGGGNWWGARGDAGQGSQVGERFRPQPFIALDFDSSVANQNSDDPNYRLTTWDFGLILATDSQVDWKSKGEKADSYYKNWKGLEARQVAVGSYTPTLYDTRNVTWRGADIQRGAGLRPVDFDPNTAQAVTLNTRTQYYGKAWEYAPSQGQSPSPYEETHASYRVMGWPETRYGIIQKSNWVWEGTLKFNPIPICTGNPADNITYSYGVWCANDTIGSIGNLGGGPPPVPEPASMGLLAVASLGIAGMLKRRRSK